MECLRLNASGKGNRLMSSKDTSSPVSASITLFTIVISFFVLISSPCTSQDYTSQEYVAPGFQAKDLDGNVISLGDNLGQPVILHITNIENPLCRECENSLREQIRELSLLLQNDSKISIITLNIRKNPYSQNGRTLVKDWWNIDATWPWIEDLEPYPITGKYIDYSTLDGGFSNPTLVLIDGQGRVARLYHVYQLGKGEIDGIQTAKSLQEDLLKIAQGEIGGIKGLASTTGVSYLGMLLLGIVTSLSPCSVALLLAMFSYVMTARRKDEYLKKSASASKEGFMIGLAFTLGMACVFFVAGLFLSDIGVFIRQASFFDLAAGLLMMILGINIIKPIGEIIEPLRPHISFRKGGSDVIVDKRSMMERLVHFSIDLFQYSSFIGAFMLGVFFAMGWAPCAISLVFPVLVWLISQDVTPLTGGIMLFVFGVGHGIPVIPIATFSRAVGGQIGEKYILAGRYVTRIFGVAVILIGLIYAARYIGFKLW